MLPGKPLVAREIKVVTKEKVKKCTETDQMSQKQTKVCNNVNAMIDQFSTVFKQTK